MALKVDYTIRETATNLRRNVTLTIAAIVTIAVSLSLFGGALLIRGGIDSMSVRWEDDVEVVVFLDRDISDEQREALRTTIDEHPEVSRSRYVDEEESAAEFRRLFERSSEMMKWLEENPEGVPSSIRIVPQEVERSTITSMTVTFQEQPGVRSATSAVEGVEIVERLSSTLGNAILITALGLLGAAVLLILNAIRMAMFARRREIEVMKLVGATNWFIRVPFMLEGVVQGLVGSMMAVGSIKLIDGFMARHGASGISTEPSILDGFVASQSTVTFAMVMVVVIGMVIGAVGSAIAISRFLRI